MDHPGDLFIGFALSNFDHTNFLTAAQRLIAPVVPGGNPEAANIRRLIIGAGALLVFAAAALRTWAAAFLRTDIVHDTGQHSDVLVADGPFRYVRNPLYLANPIMAAGIGVLASRAGFIFLVAANCFFIYRLIFREEASLLASQGESYRAYCRAVPRFLPAPRPRVAASGRVAQWGRPLPGKFYLDLRDRRARARADFEHQTFAHRLRGWLCRALPRARPRA